MCHAFAERSVLDDVTFDVPAGVLMGLLGPNGAGKTTLMRIMFGVIDPDAGQTSWQGHQVTTADRRRWGYMPQERGLYPAMPAGDQLVYLARLHGVGRSEATRSARSLLDELGLADRWSDRPDKLSGGMQQRLQLAAALVHDPEVIVLDEPFAGLDPVAVAELSTTLTDRVGAGRTVLFSSHQLDLVQDLCESIVMLDEGHTVLSGRVADLRASSGRRQLRLTIAHGDRSWLAPFPQVRIVEDRADDLRLDVPAGTDPLAVLDAARARRPRVGLRPGPADAVAAVHGRCRRDGGGVLMPGSPWREGTRLVAGRSLSDGLRSRTVRITTLILLLVGLAVVFVPRMLSGDEPTLHPGHRRRGIDGRPGAARRRGRGRGVRRRVPARRRRAGRRDSRPRGGCDSSASPAPRCTSTGCSWCEQEHELNEQQKKMNEEDETKKNIALGRTKKKKNIAKLLFDFYGLPPRIVHVSANV